MNVLDVHTTIEPGNKEHRLARTGSSRNRPSKDGLDMLVRVIGLPRPSISFTPLLTRHHRMFRNVVIEIVLIEVLIHRDASFMELFMVFRSGQRRQIKEFEKIDRQFLFDDLDIMDYRFRRIAWK